MSDCDKLSDSVGCGRGPLVTTRCDCLLSVRDTAGANDSIVLLLCLCLNLWEPAGVMTTSSYAAAVGRQRTLKQAGKNI